MSQQPITDPESNKTLRAAIWVAIGALIAAAVVCVVWVLIGDSEGVVGRAFLTILLLAAFAGIAILEANLAPRRPAWFALMSMVTWVLTLLIGAYFIWMPDTDRYYGAIGAERFFKFLLIVLILQLALLHIRLFLKAYERFQTTFTSIVTYVTIGLVAILAVMLIVAIVLEDYATFRSIYWRVVVAISILIAVGTALVPLVNALFAPKKTRPVNTFGAPAPTWPTYADAITPLPVMPDGSPDWNAYYTGQPTYPQPVAVDAPNADAFAHSDVAAYPTNASPEWTAEQAVEQPVEPALAPAPSAPEQPAVPPVPAMPPVPPVPPAPTQWGQPGYQGAPPAPPQ